MANPNDWSQFYNNQNFFSSATTATATTVTTPATSGVASGSDVRLSPEGGRVAKPARRRSRASRRTPTTLLNTDTANFRAMVQQFTGGPSAMAFGSGSGFSLTSSSTPAAGGGGGGGGLGGQQLQWQYPYQQHAHAPPRPYMFSLGNVNPLGHSNVNPNAMGVGGVNAAVPDGFGTADEAAGGGDSVPSSEVLGSRNSNTSWLQ